MQPKNDPIKTVIEPTAANGWGMAPKRVYYVSIQLYGHKVFKCAGICPDAKHEAFYVPYFEKNGTSAGTDPNGHKVVILEGFVADRITLDPVKGWIPFDN